MQIRLLEAVHVLDTEEFMAKSLFERHAVRFKIQAVMGEVDGCHRLVKLLVLKKDEAKFLQAMEDLKNKMLLCGHPDYVSAGEELIEILRRGLHREAERTGRVIMPSGKRIRIRLAAYN